MRNNTRLIELFGVPACGKSTIAGHIAANSLLPNSGTKADMYADFSQGSYLHKLASFRLRHFFDGLAFVRFFPRTAERKRLSRAYFLKAAWCRQYQRQFGKYDFIVADHGILQDIVTWERGEVVADSRRFEKVIGDYLRHEKDVVFVYCDVDIDTAIERILKRGRHPGRMDELKEASPDMLRKAFVDEQARFLRLEAFLKHNGFHVFRIGTDEEVEKTSQKLIDLIR